MATNPLETFTASEIQDAEINRLPIHTLFEEAMRRVDAEYEDRSEVLELLSQTDARRAEYILGCLATTPDLHLAEIKYPADLLTGSTTAA